MTASVGNVAIFRLPGPVRPFFSDWRKRALKDKTVVFLYLGTIALRFKVGDRITTPRVLAALGVCEDGQKVLLDLEFLPSPVSGSWNDFIGRLVERGLNRPCLVILDGGKEVRTAVGQNWPGIEVQHCTAHKLRNLQRHAPWYAWAEIRADYQRIVHADSLQAARDAYRKFIARWNNHVPQAVAILEESGEELLTFYQFPRTQWKSLRGTTAIERLSAGFCRGANHPGSLPAPRDAERLLLALVVSGQMHLRRIDGWREIQRVFPKSIAHTHRVNGQLPPVARLPALADR